MGKINADVLSFCEEEACAEKAEKLRNALNKSDKCIAQEHNNHDHRIETLEVFKKHAEEFLKEKYNKFLKDTDDRIDRLEKKTQETIDSFEDFYKYKKSKSPAYPTIEEAHNNLLKDGFTCIKKTVETYEKVDKKPEEQKSEKGWKITQSARQYIQFPEAKECEHDWQMNHSLEFGFHFICKKWGCISAKKIGNEKPIKCAHVWGAPSKMYVECNKCTIVKDAESPEISEYANRNRFKVGQVWETDDEGIVFIQQVKPDQIIGTKIKPKLVKNLIGMKHYNLIWEDQLYWNPDGSYVSKIGKHQAGYFLVKLLS